MIQRLSKVRDNNGKLRKQAPTRIVGLPIVDIPWSLLCTNKQLGTEREAPHKPTMFDILDEEVQTTMRETSCFCHRLLDRNHEHPVDGIQDHDVEFEPELVIVCDDRYLSTDQGNPSDSTNVIYTISGGSHRSTSGNESHSDVELEEKQTSYSERKEREIQLKPMETILYIIFLVIVIILTCGMITNMTFWYTNHLDDLFVKTPFQVDGGETNFQDLSQISHFWRFAETVMMDSLYGDSQDDPFYRTGAILYDSKLIGVPRLRQVKVRSDSCTVPEQFQRLFKSCFDLYSLEKEDREPFGPGNGTAWTYSTEEQLGVQSRSGIFSTYGGGGYNEDLSLRRNETTEKIRFLKENLWVTKGTRAIFFDVTAYNANVNIFLIVKLLFEIPPTGGVFTSSFFSIVKVHHYVTASDYFVIVCECVFALFTVFYTIEEIIKVKALKWNYVRSSWNFLDLAILLFSYILIVFNICKHLLIEPKLIQLTVEERFANFDAIVFWQGMYRTETAVLFSLVLFKIFKYTSVNKTIYQLGMMLCKCTKDLAAFLVMFSITFLAYAILGYLLFGTQVKDFRTFPTAVLTLFRAILQDFHLPAKDEANHMIAGIYYISYTFLVYFVLMNMFLAIINDNYMSIRSALSRLK